MGETLTLVLVAAGALAIGLYLGRVALEKVNKKAVSEIEEKGKLLIKEAELTAESIKKDKILEAREKYLKLKADFEEEANRKKNQIIANENKLKQRESKVSSLQESISRKEVELDSMKENVEAQLGIIKKRKEELESKVAEKVKALEKVANLSADEARAQLIQTLKDETDSKASALIKDIIDEAKLSGAKQAKKIVIESIQRTATEHAIENCVSIFNIESDDIKGKIIGREGRNIRALEAATGVEIIVDDTPEAIIISGFDPVRREVARLSLHRLVTDGRIHPARIEEIVAKTIKNIDDEISEIGERTVIDLGIHGLIQS